ncbi:thioesterase family protein [Leucobacter sp. BZR 635]
MPGPSEPTTHLLIGRAVFETTIHPRVSETDAIGHINNTVVPVWFEAGRREFFEVFGPVDDFSQWRMIVASFTVDFEHELTYPAPVSVHTWVERIGNSSLALYEEMHQLGKRCAVGRTTYVNVSPTTKRPERISDEVRAALQPHMTPAAPHQEESE